MLTGAARFGLERPRLALGAAGCLVALSLLSGLGVRLRSDVEDLVPAASAAAVRRLEDVFGAMDNAFLLLEAPAGEAGGARARREESLIDLARSVSRRLEREPLVRSVSFGWADLAERLLSPDLLSLAPLLARDAARPGGGAFDSAALDRLLTAEGIRERVRKQAASLGLPGIGEAEKWIERDPLELREILVSRLAALRGAFRSHPGSLHFLSEQGGALLLRIEGNLRSSDIPRVKDLVRAVRSAFAEARTELGAERPEVLRFTAGLTGGYAFAFESEETLRGDLTRNILCSFALVLSVLVWTLRRPLLAFPAAATLLAGAILGFGLFATARREVLALALVSGAILAGLGIDFVIHFVLRVFSDPRGASRASVLEAARATGPSSLFAALTTAAAFLSFPLTGERFLGDLGLLSACGILCCMGATQVLLPALLGPWIRRAEAAAKEGSGGRGGLHLPPRGLGSSLLARPGLQRPRAVLGASLLLGAASAAYLALRPPGLETDLRNLQASGSEAVRTAERIAEAFGGGGEPVLILVEASAGGADAEAAAVEAAARLEPQLDELRRRGLVAAWTSPSQLVPLARESRAALDVLSRKEPRALEEALRSALEAEGFDPERFAGPIGALRAGLERRSPVAPADLRRLGLGPELDRMLASRGGAGYALVAVHPRGAAWSTSEQEKLFESLEKAVAEAGVRGDLAGLQVVSARSAAAVVDEFLEAAGVAGLAVALLVLALFGNLVHAGLAVLPVALGTLWTAALCGLLGYKLNFMNAGILPMVIGIGVDDGIHMVKQFLDGAGRSAEAVVRATGSAVMLTSITTLAAFGTMAFSVNRGLASVGVISGIGVTMCLLASIVALPAALELHARKHGSRRP